MTDKSPKGEFRDKLIWVLITLTITNAGWFMVWLKDVPTRQELEERPPIYKAIPNLPDIVARASKTEEYIGELIVKQEQLTLVQQQLIEVTKDLKDSVKSLSKDIQSVQIDLARKR